MVHKNIIKTYIKALKEKKRLVSKQTKNGYIKILWVKTEDKVEKVLKSSITRYFYRTNSSLYAEPTFDRTYKEMVVPGEKFVLCVLTPIINSEG